MHLMEKVMKNDVKQYYSIRLKSSLLNDLKNFAEQNNLKVSELIRKILTEYNDSKINKNNIKDTLGNKDFKRWTALVEYVSTDYMYHVAGNTEAKFMNIQSK